MIPMLRTFSKPTLSALDMDGMRDYQR